MGEAVLAEAAIKFPTPFSGPLDFLFPGRIRRMDPGFLLSQE